MLQNKKTFDLATRIIMELSTPELYKLDEALHWQPRLVNHIYFLQDTEKRFCTPIVSHIDLQVFNQMAHRSPALLNNHGQNYGDPYTLNNFKVNQIYQKYGISFRETFRVIFDKKYMDQS